MINIHREKPQNYPTIKQEFRVNLAEIFGCSSKSSLVSLSQQILNIYGWDNSACVDLLILNI